VQQSTEIIDLTNQANSVFGLNSDINAHQQILFSSNNNGCEDEDKPTRSTTNPTT